MSINFGKLSIRARALGAGAVTGSLIPVIGTVFGALAGLVAGEAYIREGDKNGANWSEIANRNYSSLDPD